MAIQPFQPPYSESAVQDLRERLANTRWPDTIPGSGWDYGFDLAYLQRICRYWREQYDWKAEIGWLASLHHLQYIAGDQSIHFVHERGRGPSPIPILLLHGWPGSFLEMRKLFPPAYRPSSAQWGSIRFVRRNRAISSGFWIFQPTNRTRDEHRPNGGPICRVDVGTWIRTLRLPGRRLWSRGVQSAGASSRSAHHRAAPELHSRVLPARPSGREQS